MTALPRNRIITGDARHVLSQMPGSSVDCVVTSSPYFQLRDYQTDRQLGLEATVDAWVDELDVVLRGLARVLKPTGSLWLNLGDSYSRHHRTGAPPKSLLLAPERVAARLLDDGWTIRNKIIWAKTNPMPASVRDRLATTWEVVYFAVRSRHYYFDLDAIRIPHSSRPLRQRVPREATKGRPKWAGPLAGDNSGLARMKAGGRSGHPLGKNPGDVWQTATSNYRAAHFATYPEALIERPILAGCPARVCRPCGQPWRRRRHRTVGGRSRLGDLRPGCTCRGGHRPGVVLDPFMGAGTTAVVAQRLERDWLGIELNPDFVRLAEERIAASRSQAA